MTYFDYETIQPPIRRDLSEAHRSIWGMLAKPGNWWTGEERLAIAQESRNARRCAPCAQRRQALSPYGSSITHQTTTDLPPALVDAVHRITTDPSRIKQEWIESLVDQGISDAHYVEMLGIVVAMISIDAFHRAMGMALEVLPEPTGGAPDQYRPPGARRHGAYVPSVTPQDLADSEADLYGGAPQTGNVIAAMSLVPDAVRMLVILGGAHYLPAHQVPDPTTNGGRALSRAQIELTAGKVSALSDCFY